jgi:hypothetical protein
MQAAVPCASHSLARELGSPGLQGCICLHLRCGHIIISSCRDTRVEMGMAACKRRRNNNHPGTLIPPLGKVGPLPSPPCRSEWRCRLNCLFIGGRCEILRTLDAGRFSGLRCVHVQSACQARNVYIFTIACLLPCARATEKACWEPEPHRFSTFVGIRAIEVGFLTWSQIVKHIS